VRRLLGILTVSIAALAACVPPGPPTVGSTSGGDPYFPSAGNGGYDVRSYDLTIDYEPSTRGFDGEARIRAKATQTLSSFSLDLRGLDVESVEVGDLPAAFTHDDGELVITPAVPILEDTHFKVRVRYGGTTGQPTDLGGALYGWVSYDDGAFVANEPDGAPTWFPVNDVPTDKATYRFTVTVPEGTTVVANGDLIGQSTTAGRTTLEWLATDAMASYLAMAAIGDYDLTTDEGPGGLPILNAVDRDLTPEQLSETQAVLALQPAMIDFFDDYLGPYPFTSFGAVVDDDDDAGYALENQTRPIYSGVPEEDTVAHETAHQWLGNKVTPARWSDIWLNEGFATYLQWMWTEHTGGPTVDDQYAFVMSIAPANPFWTTVVADPTAEGLFDAAVYLRGAAFLQALRLTVGDDDFFDLLAQWAATPASEPVSTDALHELAEEVSGQDLDALFTDWLYEGDKPDGP